MIVEYGNTPYLNEKTPVTTVTPLPVRTQEMVETLLVSGIGADATARDLLGSTDAEAPSLDRASEFRTLVWGGRKTGTADIAYTVLGRWVDASGNPLGDGWLQIASGTITGSANSWFRVEIANQHCDQYRIQVTSSTSQSLFSKVVGVR